MKFKPLFIATLLTLSGTVAAQTPTLTVYTYDSFASDWGPAAKLKPLFEAQCGCELQFVPFEDGVTMFNRIRLEGKKTKADVMLGIDQFVIPEAEKSGLFVESHLDSSHLDLPIKWTNNIFIPYDFGEYAFIYDKQKLVNPPKSLKELVERQDLRVIYQDPRTSTVGRGLLFWINQIYGEQAQSAWQTLAKHTVTVGKGWTETYGAFLKGESDLVLSYTTSPLYHHWHEQNDNYVAAQFEEGHLAQVEVAGQLKSSKHPKLAQQFLAFLHQPTAQKIIAYHNVMKPVIKSEVDPAFDKMPHYVALPFKQTEPQQVKLWLNQWQQAVSQ